MSTTREALVIAGTMIGEELGALLLDKDAGGHGSYPRQGRASSHTGSGTKADQSTHKPNVDTHRGHATSKNAEPEGKATPVDDTVRGRIVREDAPDYGDGDPISMLPTGAASGAASASARKRLVPDAPALSTPRPINGTLLSGGDENVVTVPYNREKALGNKKNIEAYIKSGRDVTIHGVGSGTGSVTDFAPNSTVFYRYKNQTQIASVRIGTQTEPWDGTEAPKAAAKPRAAVARARAKIRRDTSPPGQTPTGAHPRDQDVARAAASWH